MPRDERVVTTVVREGVETPSRAPTPAELLATTGAATIEQAFLALTSEVRPVAAE